jgi:hypothetical protein
MTVTPAAEMALAVSAGLGLAAASGLRVFVPLCVASIAAYNGWLPLDHDFAWVGSVAGMLFFGTATVIEVAAYYVPWLDHLLDILATPAAVVAGMLSAAAVITGLPPALKWFVVLVGGGGMAAVTQGASVVLRAKSLVTTGGAGNALVATVELFGAALAAALAVAVPAACLILTLLFCVLAFRVAGRAMFGRKRSAR